MDTSRWKGRSRYNDRQAGRAELYMPRLGAADHKVERL